MHYLTCAHVCALFIFMTYLSGASLAHSLITHNLSKANARQLLRGLALIGPPCVQAHRDRRASAAAEGPGLRQLIAHSRAAPPM